MNLAHMLLFLALFAPVDDRQAPLAHQAPLASDYGFDGLEIYKVDDGVFGLTFDDIDGDGRQDLAFINNMRSRVELYLRLPDDAADQFEKDDPDAINEVTYDGRFKKEYLPVEQEVVGLALGRFNEDKIVDAAFITTGARLIIVLRGAAPRDEGRETIELEDFSPRILGLDAADIDGDGVDEMILLGEKKTIIYRCGDDPVVLGNLHEKPGSHSVADFDGNGLDDLLYVDYQSDYPFVIRFQQTPGHFGPAETWKLEGVRAYDVSDMDRDGRAEIAAVYRKSGRLVVFGLEKGAAPRFRYYSLRGAGDADKVSFACGDADKDGTAEVLIADPDAARITVLDGLDGREASTRREYPSLRGVADPRVADLDGDGCNDLLVVSETEGVIGISSLEKGIGFPRFVAVDGKPVACDAGDMNGDGTVEVVCLSTKGEGSRKEFILTLLAPDGSGEGNVQYTVQEAKQKDKILKKTPQDLLLSDVDGDGLNDVILFMPGEVPAILFNAPHGAEGDAKPFTRSVGEETPGLGLLEGARSWTLCPADSDQDGRIELAVASGNLVRFVFMPEGSTVPQAAKQYNCSNPADQLEGCAFADVAGDGAPELVIYERKTRTVRIVDNEDRLVERIDAGRTDFRGFETVDLNNDGKKDIVLKGRDRIGIRLSGDASWSLVERGSYESPDKDSFFLDLAAGDINASGTAEAVIVDSGQNSLFVVAHKADALKHVFKFKVFEEKIFHGGRGGNEPHTVLTHDVTNDGKEDVVIQVHDKIIIYPQG